MLGILKQDWMIPSALPVAWQIESRRGKTFWVALIFQGQSGMKIKMEKHLEGCEKEAEGWNEDLNQEGLSNSGLRDRHTVIKSIKNSALKLKPSMMFPDVTISENIKWKWWY